jgi:hypothetical protein
VSGTTIGQALPTDSTSDFHSIHFLIKQLIARVNTATLVKVQSVTNNGGVSPVGSVDVLPLVNQIDGAGNPTEHVTIHGLPYFRLQGGTNAVILDPKVGDIGIAVFASRDISTVKSAKKQSNPGSFRRFNMSDGLYFGGFLNGDPQNYFEFTDGGDINIVSTGAINITSTNALTFNASNATLDSSGNLTVHGDVVATGGISLVHHVHTGVQSGTSDTSGPIG